MGNPKQKWTAEEEAALLNGVAKHGLGKWKIIVNDPEFGPFLTQRSNIDLKDKWRNLTVSAGQGSRGYRGATKVKSQTVTVTPSSDSDAQKAAPADAQKVAPADAQKAAPADAQKAALADALDVLMHDLSNSAVDENNPPSYTAMIFEALSTTKDRNGCDLSAILHFIEQRHKVPQNFRKLLSARLRGLISKGKLVKEHDLYRIREDTELGTANSTSNKKDVQKHLSDLRKNLEEAAAAAAFKVAEAENKSFLAAEAVKEEERVSKMAEEADAMLQLMKEIHEQCKCP